MKTEFGRLLLVGAGGFVGPWITQAALAAGWSVTGYSRRAPVFPTGFPAGFNFLPGDANDPSAVAAALATADVVVFNAAYLPADYAAAGEARRCLETNALAPLTFLEHMEGSGRLFIYVSTAQHYQPTAEPVKETAASFPIRHAPYYLSSKLLGETYAEYYRNAGKVPTATLRLGSLYGPGQGRGMVGRFVQQAKKAQPIKVADGGRHCADLTFVGDVAQAIVAAMGTRATGIFNIGSGCLTSSETAARLILTAAGQPANLLDVEPCTGRPGGGYAALDITRARQELAFHPTSPADGLARTVREWVLR